MSEVSVPTICKRCGKQIIVRTRGSMTAWIFRQAECDCEKQPDGNERPFNSQGPDSPSAEETILKDGANNSVFGKLKVGRVAVENGATYLEAR